MADRVAELEAKVTELESALHALEGRLAALERTGTVARRGRGSARDAGPEKATTLRNEWSAFTVTLSYVGRTLLVLAGGFVLRALTDAGTLPGWLGVGLGLAYAGAWIALADRAGRAGAGFSAGFHGASAVLLGFPLVYEAATRFKLLSPTAAAVLLALLTAVALAVAARRRIQGFAWLVTLGGIGTALALFGVTGRMAPPLAYLVLLGIGTLWLGYLLDWHELRWPVAAVANIAGALLALRAVAPGAPEGPRTAIAILLALAAVYIASFAARTLVLGRLVVPFEVAQMAAVTAAGLGGASFVAARSGIGTGALGAAAAAVGAAAYSVAFAFVACHPQRRANFWFCSSVGLLYVLAGTALASPPSVLAVAWAALAVVMAVLAHRRGSRTLAAHASAYAVAAALAGGLLEHAAEAAFASPTAPWTHPSPASFIALFGIAIATSLAAGAVERTRAIEHVPQAAASTTVACALAGVAIGWIAPLAAGAPGAGADPAVVAVVRTAVLSLSAVAVAWAGRHERWRELGWLSYPLLAVILLKVLIEDLTRGRPATLFPAFAVYGAALILVPRIRARRASPAPQAAAPGRVETGRE